MKKRTLALALGATLALGAAALLLLLPRRADFARLRRGRPLNVVLVTLDTLRADRVGCYGAARIETPVLDGWAARGVRFANAFSATPLTLPSHTTIMTGTLPLRHGVRDNGGFVAPESLTTLAELFRARGAATGAFVAAYVLDAKWGLAQGFDEYYDRFDLGRYKVISLGSVQRRADEVLDRAIGWLEAKKEGPFFAWIHLYDPHTPYEPPAPFAERYADRPYAGEVAYTDSQLARLDSFLRTNGLYENTVVVVCGDHGESLGAHEESTHGFFVYQEALHVPLIVATPFPRLQGKVSEAVASLADVMPTVCEMAGLPAPSGLQGSSLVPSMFRPESAPRRLAYAETFYPRFHYGWSELRSVQDGRFKLIVAPVPELYDLVADPGETRNLVYRNRKEFEALRAEADALIAAEGRETLDAAAGRVDEDTREKLAALGYVGGFIDPKRLEGRTLADPKDKIAIFNGLSAARELAMGEKGEEGIRMIREILARDPEINAAWFTLGNVYFRLRRFPEAIAAFEKSLELKPDDNLAVINVANAYASMGREADAERFVLGFMAKGFEDSQLLYLLGNLYHRRGDADKALAYFERSLAKDPGSPAGHNAVAAILIDRGDWTRAAAEARRAAELSPTLLNVRYNLAQVLEQEGRYAEAEQAYRGEIRDSPHHFKALFNLARLVRRDGRADEEERLLRSCVDSAPEFPLSYFYLARILLNRGADYAEAIRLTLAGLERKPGSADLPLGYFLLADLYNRTGDPARSEEYARKGLAAQSRAPSTAR